MTRKTPFLLAPSFDGVGVRHAATRALHLSGSRTWAARFFRRLRAYEAEARR